MNRTEVAQTSGLLYRRLPACRPRASSRAPTLRASADCKSAIQQTGGLRYDTRAGWFRVLALVGPVARSAKILCPASA